MTVSFLLQFGSKSEDFVSHYFRSNYGALQCVLRKGLPLTVRSLRKENLRRLQKRPHGHLATRDNTNKQSGISNHIECLPNITVRLTLFRFIVTDSPRRAQTSRFVIRS